MSHSALNTTRRNCLKRVRDTEEELELLEKERSDLLDYRIHQQEMALEASIAIAERKVSALSKNLWPLPPLGRTCLGTNMRCPCFGEHLRMYPKGSIALIMPTGASYLPQEKDDLPDFLYKRHYERSIERHGIKGKGPRVLTNFEVLTSNYDWKCMGAWDSDYDTEDETPAYTGSVNTYGGPVARYECDVMDLTDA